MAKTLHLFKSLPIAIALALLPACGGQSSSQEEVPGQSKSPSGKAQPRVVTTPESSPARDPVKRTETGEIVAADNFKIIYPTAYVSDLTPLARWSEAPDVKDYDLILALADNCKPPLQIYGDLSTRSQQLSALSEGSYYLCLYAIQDGGLQLEPVSGPFKFTVDVTPPSVTTLNNVTVLSDDTTPTFSWVELSDADTYDVLIGPSGANCTALTDSTGTYTYTYSVTAASATTKVLGDGRYNVCLIAKDFAGNQTPAAQNNQEFIIDTTDPTDPADITLPNYSASSSVSVSFTNSTDNNFSTHNITACTDANCSAGCLTTVKDTGSPATLTELAEASTYYVCIQGIDQLGKTSNLVASSNGVLIDLTNPDAPSGITIAETSPLSDTSITVNFTVGSDANFSTHNVKACTDTACTTSCVGETTSVSTPVTIASLINSTTYYACIQAEDAAGNTSSWVASASSITVDETNPTAPSNLSMTSYSNATTVSLSYTDSTDTNFKTHNVKACTNNDCSTGCLTATTDTSSPTDLTGLSDGSSYYACVQGSDNAGNTSSWVVSSAAVVVDTTNPAAPSGINFSPSSPYSGTTATITYTVGTDTNFSTHNVKACTNNDCSTGCLAATTDADNTASLSNLVDATAYYACVQSVDLATNTSAYVASGSALTIDTTNPTDPSGLNVSSYSSTDSFSVSYTDSTDTHFSTHNVKACTANDCSTGCVGATTDTASPTSFSSLSDGTTYYACIQGEDSAGNTSNWIASAAVIIDTTNPAAPSGLTITESSPLSGNTINITYTDGTDANFSTHDVKACTANDCSTGCVGLNQDNASGSSITGLLNTTTYYACAASIDLAGNRSAWVASAATITIDQTNPADPSNVAVAANYSTAADTAITFTASTDTHFSTHNIKACTNNDCSTGCLAAFQDANSPATMTGLADGNAYYACVQGVDLAGNTSSFVASASAITIDLTNPAAPSGIAITEASPLSNTTINITYTDSTDTNFDTHNVKACTDNSCSAGCVGAHTDAASGSAITGLANTTTYYACVQGQDLAGRTSAWIASAATITIDQTNPADPSGVTVAAYSNSTSASVTYTDSTDTHFSTHNIKACTNNDCSTGCLAAIQDVTSPVTVTGMAGATAYYICAQGVDLASNTSNFVASASTVTIDLIDPAAPSGLNISQASPFDGTTINLSYTDGTDTNFNNHTIKACTDNGCSTGCVGEHSDAASPTTITGLQNGTTYYACAASLDLAGRTSAFVSSVATLEVDQTNPAPPSAVSVAAYSSSTSVSVSFTDATDANFSTHNVKACTNNDCSTGCLAAIQDASAPATLTGLSGATSYYACVQGEDLAGNTSAFVASAAAVTIDLIDPNAASGISITQASPYSGTSIDITFTDASDTNFSTHNIKACTNAGCSTACVGTHQDSASGATISGLSTGSTYYACVQGLDLASRTSAWVASAGTIEIDTTDPSAPSNISISESSPLSATSITVTYTDGTDANFNTHNVKACTNNSCSTGCVGATTDASSPVTISSLLNTTTYYACLQATDTAGNTSAWVASAGTITIDQTDPADASNVSVSSYSSSTSVSVSFTNSTDTHFSTHNVKACTNNDCSTGCLAAIQDASSPATVTGLSNGTSYYACVQGQDQAGNTANFVVSPATVTVDTLNPNPPASINITDSSPLSSSTINITFTDGSDTNFSTHNIKACTANDCSTACVGASTDTASPASITGLSTGSTYYACVQSVDLASRTSSWVASVGTIEIDETNPAPPSNLSFASSYSSSTSVSMTYTAATDTNFSTHNVKACTNTDCTTGCLAVSQDAASPVTLSGLADGNTYYGCAQGVDTAGNTSAYVASSGGVVIDTQDPNPPSGISISQASPLSASSIDITYTSGTDTNMHLHNIKACTNSGCSTGCVGATTDTTSPATISSLVTGNTYYACVQSQDLATRTSAWVASAGTIEIDATDPNPPSGISVPGFSNSATVAASFTDATDTNFSTHNVKACTNSDCSTGCLAATQDASSPANLTGLSDATSYYACIQGVDSAGNTSSYVASASAVVVDLTDPAAPASLSMTYVVNTQNITLSFTDGTDTNFSTHNVKACTDSGCSTSCVGATTDNASPATISGLSYDTAYYGCAQSVDSATNTSAWTASGSTISIETPPTELSRVGAAANSPKRVYLDWNAPGGTTADYRIAYQSGGSAPADCSSGTTIAEGSVSGTSHEITGLTAGTTYSFRVCGINSNGTPYYTSGVTATIKTTALPTPGFINLSTGYNHSCGISTERYGYCWGDDANEQLGIGSGLGEVHYPVRVHGESSMRLKHISAGGSNSCSIAFSGSTARCVGADSNGEIGNGATSGTVDAFDSPNATVAVTALVFDRFTKIETGNGFACGLTAGGLGFCWGSDTSDKLGNSTAGSQTSPDQIETNNVSGDTFMIDIDLSSNHACTVTSDGKGYCWGSDANERLGEGAGVTGRDEPQAIDQSSMGGEAPIWKAAASIQNSHMLTAAGKMWGAGTGTIVGDGTTSSRDVFTSLDFSSVSTDKLLDHASGIALSTSGKIFTWGNASSGQLGDNQTATTSTSAKAPNNPAGVSSYRAIADAVAETQKCVLSGSSQAYCFGDNTNGKLGVGDTTNRSVPTAVNLNNLGRQEAMLTIHGSHASFCATTSAGRIYCWGDNTYGQVGLGDTSTEGVPLPVAIDTTALGSDPAFKDACSAETFSAGLSIEGLLYTWGDDSVGQLGDAAGATSNAYRPVAVATANGPYRSLSCHSKHACAINAAGKIYCWGEGANGRLGTGSTADSFVPTAVDDSGIGGEKTWISVAAGGTHTCAVNSEGKGYCWGAGANGRLGAGSGTSSDQTTPVAWDETGLAGGEARFRKVVAGNDFSCAITAKGVVYCFGLNANGQLGVGDTTLRWYPTSINRTNPDAASQGPFVDIFGYYDGACAITSRNLTYCWGDNASGEVGDNTTSDRTTPVALNTTLLPQAETITIARAQATTCALNANSQVYCWGADNLGQAGNGSTTGTTYRPPASPVDWGSEAAPSDPSNINVVADSATQVTVSWDAGGGTTSGYRIAFQKGSTPTDCQSMHTVGQDAISGTSHTINDLVTATTYYFRVCSANDDPVPELSSGITGSVTTP